MTFILALCLAYETTGSKKPRFADVAIKVRIQLDSLSFRAGRSRFALPPALVVIDSSTSRSNRNILTLTKWSWRRMVSNRDLYPLINWDKAGSWRMNFNILSRLVFVFSLYAVSYMTGNLELSFSSLNDLTAWSMSILWICMAHSDSCVVRWFCFSAVRSASACFTEASNLWSFLLN